MSLQSRAELCRFKGVGPKTASCVMLFELQRQDFPVDTHVWKIAIALGWVPKSASRDQTYEHLNEIVPDEIKYELHVLLVRHGKDYRNEVKVLRAAVREGRDFSAGAALAHEQELLARVAAEAGAAVKPEPAEAAAVKPEIVD